jgi:ADP-ribosylation factor GTPase-activating protein 1
VARATDLAQNVSQGEGNEDWRKYLNQGVEGAKGAAEWMGQHANKGWGVMNEVAKSKGGVDLNEQLGRLGMSGRSGNGYDQLKRTEDGGKGDDDFFESWNSVPSSAATTTTAADSASSAPASATRAGQTETTQKKGSDWAKDDEWKDF